MLLRTRVEDLPPDLVEPLTDTELIIRAYLKGVSFIIGDTARDSSYRDNHLLAYIAQDILQSAIAILYLPMEGLLNVAKRELRFLVEASIKICFVQQKSYHSTIAEKLDQFERELASQRISIKKNLKLSMLPTELIGDFNEEVGRIYGRTSNYVHLTPLQIQERIRAVDEHKTFGKETAADIAELNELLSRALAASLVLLYHSVPGYVAGDWFVETDGSTVDWYFTQSRFIAGVDTFFDYKHERQARLAEIRIGRREKVRF